MSDLGLQQALRSYGRFRNVREYWGAIASTISLVSCVRLLPSKFPLVLRDMGSKGIHDTRSEILVRALIIREGS